ncbi:MAG TPA: hypothetical protein VFJ65_08355 [Solirubrobacterales bacterium]|nr:hypothetical protein [Solirubrobacterales bacterium]
MKRISEIKKHDDFDTEERREALRELRSKRHRRMIVTVSSSTAILLAGLGTMGLRVPLLPLMLSLL